MPHTELLCRAYPSDAAGDLQARTKQRLNYISRLLQGRLTLAQHRELLVTAGWLALLLGCVHYDLGEREQAEAARQAAYQAGLQAGHGEIIAWSYEMAAWFALTEGPYHDVIDYAQAGQQHAGLTNVMTQLAPPAAGIRLEVWVSSPEPTVGVFTPAGTCRGRLRRHS